MFETRADSRERFNFIQRETHLVNLITHLNNDFKTVSLTQQLPERFVFANFWPKHKQVLKWLPSSRLHGISWNLGLKSDFLELSSELSNPDANLNYGTKWLYGSKSKSISNTSKPNCVSLVEIPLKMTQSVQGVIKSN